MTLYDLYKNPNLKFLLFGGKGGVGKTSCAAATATWMADYTKKEILILSTDPAHSLSDSFDQKIGSEAKLIWEFDNLYGLELDPSKAAQEAQAILGGGTSPDMVMDEMTMSPFGPMEDLTPPAPPGTDEALAFGKVLEFIEKSDYDLIIFDTAPTGHTLRLLGLPDFLDGWVGKIIKLRYSLSSMFGKLKKLFGRQFEEDKTMEVLEKLKESVEKAKIELSDINKTEFIVVMIPEMMAIQETERLLSALYEFEMPVRNIVVNMIFPKEYTYDCTFCKARRKMQEDNFILIEEYYKEEFNITELPLFSKEIRGVENLRELADLLFVEK